MSDERSEACTQWRVGTKHRRMPEPLYQACADEHAAREWMRLERIDYPHADIWIESREVTPWRRSDITS
jgi:hypothetical protein